jgi:hypothetical protein
MRDENGGFFVRKLKILCEKTKREGNRFTFSL